MIDLTKTVTIGRLIEFAGELSEEFGFYNHEYDRAMVNLVSDAAGLTQDEQGEMEKLIGKASDDFYREGRPIPRYKATFDPQVWINDEAVSVDPRGDTTWDCTGYVAAYPDYFGERFREELKTIGHFLDVDDYLKDDRNAPKWVREWDGPFTITVVAEGD